MSDLHNESIFITGGGSGLGLALVERFIEEGAQVATLELSAAKVASLRQRFGEHILAVEGNRDLLCRLSTRGRSDPDSFRQAGLFYRQCRHLGSQCLTG